jgi:hypothetical protein
MTKWDKKGHAKENFMSAPSFYALIYTGSPAFVLLSSVVLPRIDPQTTL